jgi:Ca2+-binding EF-hand superfamily protein
MRGEMKEKMEARFKEADANGDGQLSLDEVQAKMPRLADRFTTLDTDKNGQLSKDELKHGGPGHHPPQPQS